MPKTFSVNSSLYISLLAILLLGAFLRLWQLEKYPEGFAGHSVTHLGESYEMLDSIFPDLLEGKPGSFDRLKTALFSEREGPFVLINALGGNVFGRGFTEAQLTQATIGILTVFVAWLAGAEAFSPLAGLFLALLLAVCPWHLNYSRYSDAEHILAPLQFLAAAYLLLCAERKGKSLLYILAGAFTGLCWYVYATNQILPAAVFLYFCWRSLTRGYVRERYLYLLSFITAFLVVSAPHLLSHVSRDAHFFGIFRQSHALGETMLLRESLMAPVRAVFQELFSFPRDEWLSRPGGALGVMDAAALVLSPLILFFWLRRSDKRNAAVFFLICFILSPLPALLGPGTPFRRLMLTGLISLILASAAMAGLFEYLRKRKKLLGCFVLALIVAASCVKEVSDFFTKVALPETNGGFFHKEVALCISDPAEQRQKYVFVGDRFQKALLAGYYAIAMGRSPRASSLPPDTSFIEQGELETFRAGPRLEGGIFIAHKDVLSFETFSELVSGKSSGPCSFSRRYNNKEVQVFFLAECGSNQDPAGS